MNDLFLFQSLKTEMADDPLALDDLVRGGGGGGGEEVGENGHEVSELNVFCVETNLNLKCI